MIDHLRNTMAVHLEDVEILVLDESDRLLELGFQDEVRYVILCYVLCCCYVMLRSALPCLCYQTNTFYPFLSLFLPVFLSSFFFLIGE
jgi:hypothetical protein